MSEQVEQKPDEIPVNKNKEAMLIPVSESGLLAPTNQKQLVALIGELLKSGSLPKWYQNTAQVLTAWNYAASLGLTPQPNLKNIALIDGTPCLFGDAPRALAQKTGELEYCKVFVCNDKYERICFENKNLADIPFAGICQIKRKGRDPESFSFSVEDAKKAGLWGRVSKSGAPSPWVKYDKIMLMRRAQAMALKFEFAEALSGVEIAEYTFNEAPDLKDVTPSGEREEVLNKIYGADNGHIGNKDDGTTRTNISAEASSGGKGHRDIEERFQD